MKFSYRAKAASLALLLALGIQVRKRESTADPDRLAAVEG